ncbi:MAG: FixH family protein [Verrucomicrobiota bacterium]
MKTSRSWWPLGIVAGCVFYLSGIGVCAWLACTHKSELVAANYYDQEIRFQSRIDSQKRAASLATPARVAYDDSTRAVLFTLPPEHAAKPVTGEIVLYRPAAAGLDRQVALVPGPDGRQTIDVSSLPRGLWQIGITWTVAGVEYFHGQKIVLGPPSLQARLNPVAPRATN